MKKVKKLTKNFFALVLACLLMVGSVHIPVYAIDQDAEQDKILLEENFESKEVNDPLEDWRTVNGNSSVFKKVVDDNGNKVMNAGTTAVINKTEYYEKSFEEQSSGMVEVNVKAKAGQKNAAGYIVLAKGNTNLVQLQLHNNGKIIWNKGGGNEKTIQGSYEVNTWYQFKILMNLSDKCATVWIDGNKVIENEPLNDTSVTGMDNVKVGVAWGTSNPNQSYFYDDFEVIKKAPVAPEKITLSQETAEMEPGAKLKLTANVEPLGAVCEVEWKTDNAEVATVSADGEIKAIGEGKATITASVKGNGTIQDSCVVTVKEPDPVVPESIQMNRDKLTLRQGDVRTLDYDVVPKEVYGGNNVTYKSSDNNIVSVGTDGTLIAKQPGKVNITAYAKGDESIQDSCEVEVKGYAIDKVIYVSEDGNDDNDGSKNNPFLTLERAADEVKKYNSDMQGDIIVLLKNGTYTMTETLELNQEISGTNGWSVVFKAYEDQKAIISGGMELTGWKPLNDGSGLYYVTVDEDIDTRQLYVNGELATRARSQSGLPNSTYDKDNGNAPSENVGHTTTAVDMVDWKNQSDIELVYQQNWTNPRCPVEKIVEQDGKAKLIMQQPAYYYCRNKYSTSTTNPIFIENAFELLDEKGEWYLDQTGEVGKEFGLAKNTFYYLPKDGEDMEQVETIVPVLEEVVNIKGTLDNPVEYVKFEGIAFEHSTWLRPGTELGLPDAQGNVMRECDKTLSIGNHQCREYVPDGAVNFAHTEYMEFNRCYFHNLGGTALVGKDGCNETVIQNNIFSELSAGAVQLGEVDMYTEDYYNPSDERKLIRNTWIENNIVTDTGREYWSSTGIAAAYPSNITIKDNTLYNLPYSAMHIGWGWEKRPVFATENVVITGNHIYDLMKILHDGGAIYTLGYTKNDSAHMNRIEGNYIHEQWNNFGLIYLDEGSNYYEAFGNVVSTAKKPDVYWLLHKHATNRVYDNYTDSKVLKPTDVQKDNYYIPDGNWPEEAVTIMENAGAKNPEEDKAYGVYLADLQTLLDEAEAITDESAYTEASWETFVTAKETAKQVVQNANSTSGMIIESLDTLRLAMAALELKAQEYDIKIANMEHGQVTTSVEKAEEGTLVEVEVVPEEGYTLTEGSLKANGNIIKDNQFVMPANDVTITAEFEKAETEQPEDKPDNKPGMPDSGQDSSTPKTGDSFAGTTVMSFLMSFAVVLIIMNTRLKKYKK